MIRFQHMATRISKEITFDGGTVKNMAERISEQIKTPDEQIEAMAAKISKEITFDGGTVTKYGGTYLQTDQNSR